MKKTESRMERVTRCTVVVPGRLASRIYRLAAARDRQQGMQVMTFEQLVARLAGGMAQPVDSESLRIAVQAILPATPLGELDRLKPLPGLVGSAVDTLEKVWRAGLDLQARAHQHSRLESLARLESAAIAALPPALLRPADLVRTALERTQHVSILFGPIDIVGITELSPCWRPVLRALAARVKVRWIAGPRSTPPWLDEHSIEIVRAAECSPEVVSVSAATVYHEALESLRWARELIASRLARPEEIGIASVTPADYDDHFLTLRAVAAFDLHFVHGVKITTTREGQAAGALADVLVRGLSQSRIRRLATLLSAYPGPLHDLPEGWTRVLPADAPLTSTDSWWRWLACLQPSDWPDKADHNASLREIINLLSRGTASAEAAGDVLLRGRVLALWKSALRAGPAASIDLTLDTLKEDDGLEPCTSVAWMPASALAACPRPFVRLLGLNSSRWPRGIVEDRLLSDHIIPTAELDPLPLGAADRRDFTTILATTERQVVLSHARRGADGRLLGRSVLLQNQPKATSLRRNRIPQHAFSETDRLMAQPREFQRLPQAHRAISCWRNWTSKDLTPHDGLIRADHPVIKSIIERTQSATSLQQLLRNPLGFVWRYALRWGSPESGEDPLTLDGSAMGKLVHEVLGRALRSLASAGGAASAGPEQIDAAIDGAAHQLGQEWEHERAVPPRLIWRQTLSEARELSRRAFELTASANAGSITFSEVPFGGEEPKFEGPLPWAATAPVEIPNTGCRIQGYIDRLDVSTDTSRARVYDFKTGKALKADTILAGGKELQRCLYAFAVKALLGDSVTTTASLLFLREHTELPLESPEAILAQVTIYLQAARANLLTGSAVIGPDSGGDFDKLAFALPANASAGYCARKMPAVRERLGVATELWDVP